MKNRDKLAAEFLGTFWLIFAGCGSAILSPSFDQAGIGRTGVALAFGLAYAVMYYGLGHISGAHFNPAVTLGLWAGKRFPGRWIFSFITAQVMGAIFGSMILFLVADGSNRLMLSRDGFAANGFGLHSPEGYDLVASLATELTTTFFFVLVFLGATDTRAPKGFAGLAIGFALVVIHLVSLPITNTSMNPARSTSQAFYVGSWAVRQLWFFWVVPLAGALLAGWVYRQVFEEKRDPEGDPC